MEKNEIKKKLYKEKPLALLLKIKKDNLYYRTNFEDGFPVNFEIPIKDIGDAEFFPTMDAKLLIRYLQ